MDNLHAPDAGYAFPSIVDSWVVCATEAVPNPEVAPENGISLFRLLSSITATPSSSSHTVEKMTFPLADGTHAVVYYKKCDPTYPPILAQIEAAASSSCRLTIGEKAAKVVPVIDERGLVVGSISFEFTGFEPFNSCKQTIEDLIRLNATEGLVCRYVRQDDDFHPGNGGVAKGRIVHIDFDMFYYPMTAQIKGPRVINNGYFAPEPADAFPYSLRDFREFPNIQDQKPCHWPAKSPANINLFKDWKQKDLYQKLTGNREVEIQKWTAFLTEALVTPEMHYDSISPCFAKDADSQEWRCKLYQHVVKRHDDLAALLPHSPEFRHFLVRSPRIYTRVSATFRNNDERFKAHEPELRARFCLLVRRCMAKDLTKILFQMGSYFHKGEAVEDALVQPYYRLLGLVQQFYEDTESYEAAFNQLDYGLMSMESLLYAGQDKPWAGAAKQFRSFITAYRNFCDNSTPSIADSIFLRPKEHETIHPLNISQAPRVVAGAIRRWLESPGCQRRLLAIIKDCQVAYTPYSSWDPRHFTRVRGSELDALAATVAGAGEEPGKVVDAIRKFCRSGAWNQAGVIAKASANVLLIDRIATAALEEFKTMLSPQLLKNHELAEVCYLIKNDKWKLTDHAKAIAEELSNST